jgi:hypothetical protein
MAQTAHVQLCATADAGGDTLRLRTFIEVQLIGEDQQPITGVNVEITLTGGKVIKKQIGDEGFVRIDGIAAGTCKIYFPDLDQEAWVPANEAKKESEQAA